MWISSMLIVDASTRTMTSRERSAGSASSDISRVSARVPGVGRCLKTSARTNSILASPRQVGLMGAGNEALLSSRRSRVSPLLHLLILSGALQLSFHQFALQLLTVNGFHLTACDPIRRRPDNYIAYRSLHSAHMSEFANPPGYFANLLCTLHSL
jgi:hypothetical protein